jgi:hypothetical protein
MITNNQSLTKPNLIVNKNIIQPPTAKFNANEILEICKEDNHFFHKRRRYKKYKRVVDSYFKYTVLPFFPELHIVHTDYAFSYIYGYCLSSEQSNFLENDDSYKYLFGFPFVGVIVIKQRSLLRLDIYDAYHVFNFPLLYDSKGVPLNICHIYSPDRNSSLAKVCAYREDDISSKNFLIAPIKSSNSLYLAYMAYDKGEPFTLHCHKHYSKPGDPD